MTFPQPFGLAIVFDQKVRPEYRSGIIAMIAADRQTLACEGGAGKPVILVDGVSADVIARAQRNIAVAGIGLKTDFMHRSLCGLGFAIELTHNGQKTVTAVKQQLLITTPEPVRSAA